MQTVRPGRCRRDGVGHRQTAIAVTMPVDLDVFAGIGHHLLQKADDARRAFRRCMPHRIGHTHPFGPGFDGAGEQTAHVFGLRTGGVFGDVHHRQTVFDAVGHTLFGQEEQAVHVPRLGVLADRRRTDEGRHLERHAGALRNLDDRLAVLDHGARRGVGEDRQFLIDDLPRDPQHILENRLARRRQPDVGPVDAERRHQVHDFELLLDRWRAHRRRLQPVAQGFVVQLDVTTEQRRLVPVVDEIRFAGPIAEIRFVHHRRSSLVKDQRARTAAESTSPTCEVVRLPPRSLVTWPLASTS